MVFNAFLELALSSISQPEVFFLSVTRFKEPALQQSHRALLCQNPNDELYIHKRQSPAGKTEKLLGVYTVA